ncbi:hypothetical protein P691DRAFT_787200 [Macrolepiota fuliginosa MF-IS2]|uniref:Uncharacterized protein n=1 Tax=Macrolepiota fuliginosa MF-IS2 TaxID=1400762 RepID=A0A9P5XH81_9AGAR|nr:hypothetical protein P691DRAFT_787200 [Macrolepiota fuliginosa MF-IS2]
MSEDDRAAKAARAKAMLKKRQQKKAAEAGGPASDVTSPPSRTMTPALSEPVAEERKRNHLDDVFGANNDSDTTWLSSLPRAPSPPGRVATPSSVPAPIKSPPPSTLASTTKEVPVGPYPKESDLQREVESLHSIISAVQGEVQRIPVLEGELKSARTNNAKLEELLEQERAQYSTLESRFEELRRETSTQFKNHEDTISLLVSEKATLTSELHRLDEAEARAQHAEEALAQEQETTGNLDMQLKHLEENVTSLNQSLSSLQRKEKEMNEKHREQERQLQLITASASEARKDAERYQRSLKELEEQIQNDDRLERMEASLKNTQERADELEFQLSKVKHVWVDYTYPCAVLMIIQAHALVKTEKEALESQLSESIHSKSNLDSRFSELEKKHETTVGELATLIKERDILMTEKTSFDQLGQGKDVTIAGLNTQLSQAATEVNNQKRQVQTLQNDLRTAHRRVEDAEKTQQRLQNEGTNLMRSLDELRPKVVELTEDKVQLSEKVAHLEHALRDRDNVISNLETSLEDIRQESEKTQLEWRTKLSRAEKDWSEATASSSEIEKGFSELQKELEDAWDSIRTLETERQSLRQEVQAKLLDVEQLSNASHSQAAEVTRLQHELNERRADQEEEEGFLEQAQNEIESLRSELTSKTIELEQLRQSQSPPSQNGSPPTLNEEMLNSLRQQHALDLSAAQSQIRALENSVFDAEARAHGLQKQVHSLEAQLALARPSSRLGQRSFSPNHVSRPGSRVQSHSELGRSSFSSSQRPPALSRSIFDQNLTPETRHKRKVSLSMLKARIESEVAVNTGPPSRALSPVPSQTGSESPSQTEFTHSHMKGPHRPQFLDESHVFWCSSCTGELVVL